MCGLAGGEGVIGVTAPKTHTWSRPPSAPVEPAYRLRHARAPDVQVETLDRLQGQQARGGSVELSWKAASENDRDRGASSILRRRHIKMSIRMAADDSFNSAMSERAANDTCDRVWAHAPHGRYFASRLLLFTRISPS